MEGYGQHFPACSKFRSRSRRQILVVVGQLAVSQRRSLSPKGGTHQIVRARTNGFLQVELLLEKTTTHTHTHTKTTVACGERADGLFHKGPVELWSISGQLLSKSQQRCLFLSCTFDFWNNWWIPLNDELFRKPHENFTVFFSWPISVDFLIFYSGLFSFFQLLS